MVETEYALRKFIDSANEPKSSLLFFNIETISAVKNLSKILKSKSFKFLDGVVLGRSDLTGSLNKSKQHVNSKEIFKIVESSFKLIKKKKKLIVKMGGQLRPNQKNLLEVYIKKKLLDFIETRNIEIKLSKKKMLLI